MKMTLVQFNFFYFRWAIHMNVTVIPRSHDPRHILLNYKTLEIELNDNEIKLITEEWRSSKSQGKSEEDGRIIEEPTEKDEDSVGIGKEENVVESNINKRSNDEL